MRRAAICLSVTGWPLVKIDRKKPEKKMKNGKNSEN
jgi:hypothetical protein